MMTSTPGARTLTQPKFLAVLFAGNQDRPILKLGPKHRLLIHALCEWQGDLTSQSRAALEGEHDLRAATSMVKIALVDSFSLQPIRHLLNVGRHVQIVVHDPCPGLVTAGFGDRAPTPVGKHLGESLGALGANAVFAPPFGDFRLVRGTGATLIDCAQAVSEVNEAGDVIGRWMVIGKLHAPRRLRHSPDSRSVIVKPAGVID